MLEFLNILFTSLLKKRTAIAISQQGTSQPDQTTPNAHYPTIQYTVLSNEKGVFYSILHTIQTG